MIKSDLRRLIKLEEKIHRIALEDLKLECIPIEFDVVPPQKMLEIMAYRSPSNISNWKFGRDWEKLRTIYEKIDPGLPYEVVINSDPTRAYLMNSNTLTVQCLVIAHVYGHSAFFSMNKWFANSRRDILTLLSEANKRFNEYERKFGIDEVESIVDAGHSIQLHCDPFNTETENEKRERIFKQLKLENRESKSEFSDLTVNNKNKVNEDIELHNQRVWRKLKNMSPVEPTGDLLRFIIDNASNLEDWQKDILEVLREEGIYYWPIIKTKYMNEGFAVLIHEYIMNKLFNDGDLLISEHSEYTFSNSLVKASNRAHMNPYLVGSKIWEDIKLRWDKGKYGEEWEECNNIKEKEEWDTKEGNGMEKIFSVLKNYTDWFFMYDFLTVDLVDDLDLYIYRPIDRGYEIEYVRTNHTAKDIRNLIISSFSHSGIPNIDIINGNYDNMGSLGMKHRFDGVVLDVQYAEKTLLHVHRLWNKKVSLVTVSTEKGEITMSATDKGAKTTVGGIQFDKP